MYTPESIEALSRENIPEVRKLACELHQAIPELLNTPLPPKALEEQESLRTAMNLKLSEVINDVDARIADLDALKKDLRILKGYTASDRKRIESSKIETYIQEKQRRISSLS